MDRKHTINGIYTRVRLCITHHWLRWLWK